MKTELYSQFSLHLIYPVSLGNTNFQRNSCSFKKLFLYNVAVFMGKYTLSVSVFVYMCVPCDILQGGITIYFC